MAEPISASLAAAGSFIMSNWATIAAVTTATTALAATGLNAYGQYQRGEAERAAAYTEAASLEGRAKQERAVAQLEAARRRKAGQAQISEQRSLLASSGFAPDDPTGRLFLSETVGAQTLEEMLALAQGEDSARGMEADAYNRRVSGRNASKAGRLGAVVTAMEGASSWYDRYGSSAAPRTTTKLTRAIAAPPMIG